jgi:hypothetical protein
VSAGHEDTTKLVEDWIAILTKGSSACAPDRTD